MLVKKKKTIYLAKMYHKFVCFFLVSFFSSAQLHHSSISSQSVSYENSAIKVMQTIGQTSPIGNFSSSRTLLIQGFQQPLFANVLMEYIPELKILTYPNPFNNELNVKFLNQKINEAKFNIYDISGRFIKSLYKRNFKNNTKLDLQGLSSAEYILNIEANQKTYSNKIFKK